MPPGRARGWSNAGLPAAGCLLYTYEAGTSTPKATYTDAAGTTPHPNPVVLDAKGEALIYWDGNYKIDLRTAAGVQITGYPVDNFETPLMAGSLAASSGGGMIGFLYAAVYGAGTIGKWLQDLATSAGSGFIGFIQAGVGAIMRTTQDKLRESVSMWDFMSAAMRADALSGAPVLDHLSALNAAIVALGGAGTVKMPRMQTAVYLLKGQVDLGTSNAVASNVSIDIEPGVLIKSTLPTPTSVLFSLKNLPGNFTHQYIRNLRVQSTNGNGCAVKFNGQCGGGLPNFYIEGFTEGILFSNAGAGVFNEFVHCQGELHLNSTALRMDKDGGTDVSMHGIDLDLTLNVASGQSGFVFNNVNWYNATFKIKGFPQAGHTSFINMNCNSADTGVFGSGMISCEGGPAILTGTGRFWFDGVCNFMSGATDTLTPVNAWEPGFNANNYLKPQAYGTSGYQAEELRQKRGLGPTFNGPYGSLARLTGTNVESFIANSIAPHATNAGNGFFTGYTTFQGPYTGGVLGWFLASDGSEQKSFAPAGTNVVFRAGALGNPYGSNAAFSIKDGKFLVGGNTQVLTGSGSPNGVVIGSVGDVYLNRTGGAGTSLYEKEAGSATNLNWVGK